MGDRFAVVGAGAAGLCAAKALLAKGVGVTVFEVGSRVGGLWVYDNDSGLSPAYRSLHINSEAKVSAYGDFPFPPGCSLYPDHAEMARYFADYADHFDLRRHIRFKSRVVGVEPAGGRLRVTLEGGGAEAFDGVVVATGHQSVARDPEGLERYAGRYLHAHAYRSPEPFAGQNVLVIGPGNSGVDIAADVCILANRTVISARSPVLIMPRMMFGRPSSRTLAALEKPWIPWAIRVRMRAALTRVFHGRMEQWGFRTPATRTHPISHPTLFSHMAWGRIAAKPGIASAEGRTVTFTDGSAEAFDAVIAATGYRTEFPYLAPDLSPLDRGGHRLNLYHRIVHPSVPGLFFVGFFDVSGGSNIRMMDDQSEYVAAVAAGEVRLPPRGAMLEAVREDHDWAARQFPDRPRYGLELDPRRYRGRLAADYARAGAPPRPGPPLAERPPRRAGGGSPPGRA